MENHNILCKMYLSVFKNYSKQLLYLLKKYFSRLFNRTKSNRRILTLNEGELGLVSCTLMQILGKAVTPIRSAL